MSAKLYEFTQEDVVAWSNHPLFQEAVRISVAYCFTSDPMWYRGDASILKTIDGIPAIDIWDKLGDGIPTFRKSLAYLVLSEKIDETTIDKNKLSIQQDLNDRQALINKSDVGNEIAKYTYLHHCQEQAVFITAALCKLMWGTNALKKMYVRTNMIHTVLTNYTTTKEEEEEEKVKEETSQLVFDFIAQHYNDDDATADVRNYLLNDAELLGTTYIPYTEAGEWYIREFGSYGVESLKVRVRAFMKILLE